MPNAHVVKKDFKQFPIKNGEFCYKFIAVSKYDKLVFVEGKGENFFLQIIDKDDKLLLKADKITRFTNVKIIQDSIKNFIKANDFDVLQSNINSTKNHLKIKSPYQKDIFFYKDYTKENDVEIEIGFGSGRHLLHKAKQNPNKEFIGIEIHKPSIEQLLKQCKLQNITNISVIDYDARILMQMMDSNSIEKIYIHFPVPWDKKPHRRVISKSFLDESIRILKKDGRLELRTDSENYFKYSSELFLSLKQYEVIIKKNSDIEISSKYEDRWKKIKKNIYDIHLINSEISENNAISSIKEFEKKINFAKIFDKFSNHTIKKSDYFVHIENIYKINKNSGVIKLSFGSYDRSEHRYILVVDNNASYFPTSIIPTKQNILADQIIKRYIYE